MIVEAEQKNDMKERIELARAGRKFWLKLVSQYQIDGGCYCIVLPPEAEGVFQRDEMDWEEYRQRDKVYREAAIKYLPLFLKKKHAGRSIILTHDASVTYSRDDSDMDIRVCLCSRDELNSLIQFYCLYEFTTNIVIASLVLPPGRKGDGIVGHKGLSSEEVFAGVVYGLVDGEV